MNQQLVNRIVAAVLYEGYILYPYRPSVKNHKRWTFGGIYPRCYSESQLGNDRWWTQTECLIRGDESSRLEVKVHFLHLADRLVRGLAENQNGPGAIVETLEVDGRRYQTWQEAVERGVSVGEGDLALLTVEARRLEFHFHAKCEFEQIYDARGKSAGYIERRQKPVEGVIVVEAVRVACDLFRCLVRIENHSPLQSVERDEALRSSLVSAHAVLGVRGGEFVSLIDPPDDCRESAAACENVGVWPVFVGAPGERDTILASPIILYDYPEIAKESPGNLFDSTEIDEILSLRILTLTDAEKQSAAALDAPVRELLERTRSLGQDELLAMHGTVRGLRPVAPGGSS
jgi:hydrogenase maturation protease